LFYYFLSFLKCTGDYFANRTWQGMDEGLDRVLVVEDVKEGRKGIAASYSNEIEKK
jgi:hypothetical protein